MFIGAIVGFAGAKPTPDTVFKVLKPPVHAAGTSKRKHVQLLEKSDVKRLVLGENERMEYAQQDPCDMPCRFLIGVVEDGSNKIRVKEVSPVCMLPAVKSMKLMQPTESSGRQGADARRDLGETFGTRKAKQAIRSYERGQIDVAGLTDIKGHIQNTIEEKASNLATPEIVEKEASLNRPIPPYDTETPVVEKVYAFDDLMSPNDQNAIMVDEIMGYKKKDFTSLKESRQLPEFVMERLETAVRMKDKKRVQSLVYASYLIGFRTLTGYQLNNDRKVYEILGDVPDITLQRLYDLFTESHPSGDDKFIFQMPDLLKDKLTAYLCALCLHIDAFAVAVSTLAKDLKLTPTKTLDYFRQLGCVVESSSMNGVSVRRARLTAPVQFPKPPRRRMK